MFTTEPSKPKDLIIVTGGAGFIGSNIIRALNQRGETDILVVDDLTDGHKFSNLVDCEISDYLDKDEFIGLVKLGRVFGNVKAIFHQGACSTTTEWDGKLMMRDNFEFSKQLLYYCDDKRIPLIYASSAATYGLTDSFKEEKSCEGPLNVYGYSKLLFDNFLRKQMHKLDCQVVGLRYFNVYGPGENHKGSQASVAYHFNGQIKENKVCKLFEGSGGFEAGEQRRDFVSVVDVSKVNLWFMDNPNKSGIFNVGTGKSQTFNDVANAVINWHGEGKIEYIPFPDKLEEAYQSFTEADISALRAAGYSEAFASVESGVAAYLDYLNKQILPTY